MGGKRTVTREEKLEKIRVNRIMSKGPADVPLVLLVLLLTGIGVLMVFSASFARAFYESESRTAAVALSVFLRQAVFAGVGIVAMFVASKIDYHVWRRWAVPILGLAIFLLVLVIIPHNPLAWTSGGATRWLNLGFTTFQPSEVAKFALILIFSHLISLNFEKMGTFRYGVLPYVLILGSIALLVVMEKHMSATLIILMLGVMMMFIGGVKWRWFVFAVIGLGLAALYLLVFTDVFSYAMDRVYGWLSPFDPPEGVDTWQTRQSLMTIGSGGLLGLGLGQSRQKYLYLPEPQNDFIFAIVCEELGFIGALIIIILFAMLVWRGIVVSLKAKDKFGMLLGVGLTFQIGLQVILNIMVVTNTIPNTGISLPFFSYGGTSLIMLLAEMGVVLSISRNSSIEKL